jgi:hypothetical protein
MKILGQGDLRGKIGESLQSATAQDVLDCFNIGSENRLGAVGLKSMRSLSR